MDKLHSMRVVIAIADTGSLTGAATYLNTSLPTVVRVLAATERSLGIRLFERTTRQVRITEEGRLYVAGSRQVLNEVSEIEDALLERRTEPIGLLNITAPVLFGRLHVTPMLNSFLHRYPDVSAKLILIDRVVDLIEEDIDVAVRIGSVSDADLVATTIGSVRRCLCASPSLLETIGPIGQADDLRQAPFVRVLGLMPINQVALESSGTVKEITLTNIRVTTNHADAAVTSCVEGLGIGMFLSYQIQEAVAAGKLRVILEEFEPKPLPVSLVYSPTKRVSARTRAFIAWAKQHLGKP
ncbi:MAG: LysR family transcriptional regulator [Burkholderiales bacterium]|nr:LysR family transcriptional regulator [Burkholderiales bacterium]